MEAQMETDANVSRMLCGVPPPSNSGNEGL